MKYYKDGWGDIWRGDGTIEERYDPEEGWVAPDVMMEKFASHVDQKKASHSLDSIV